MGRPDNHLNPAPRVTNGMEKVPTSNPSDSNLSRGAGTGPGGGLSETEECEACCKCGFLSCACCVYQQSICEAFGNCLSHIGEALGDCCTACGDFCNDCCSGCSSACEGCAGACDGCDGG